jgi:putative addiction module killer protein
MATYRIEHYLTVSEHQDLYIEWLLRLPDIRARVAVARRVARIEQGCFGDHQLCRKGVWQLNIDMQPGYRVYYGLSERRVVLLQGGGGNRTHRLEVDQSVGYWQDWQRRRDDEK